MFSFLFVLFVSVSRPFAFCTYTSKRFTHVSMKYFASKSHIFLCRLLKKHMAQKREKNFLAETMSAGHWPLRQQSHL